MKLKNDIKRIVDRIIDNNERMKREDGHDVTEKYLVEEYVVEDIADYIEETNFKGPALNLMIEVRKELIKEGYTFLY